MKYSKELILSLVFLLSFSNFLLAELTDSEKALLEDLAPDQRESVLLKMEQKDSLTEEMDEIFENKITLIERPELKGLEDLDDDEICKECIYGYHFFKFSPSSFAPTSDVPIPLDYILGPGDKLEFTYYGNENKKSESFISRDGSVILPLLGPVNLLGITFEEARNIIQKKVNNELIGTDVSVSLKELRSISIYMLGEAYKPGKYTVSGLSTVINALFVSGGVNENGSLRNIQVKRNDKVIANYDFYNFLLKGSTQSNVRLQDGDVIFIPFIENKVRLGGAFKRSGNYEFITGETVKDSIFLAGGLRGDASRVSPIEVNSINKEAFKREIIYLKQGTDSLERQLLDGDVINLPAARGIKSETIKVSGEVNNPGEYSILSGDTILDIINRAGGYTDESYSEGAVFLRESVAKLQKESFDRSADQIERMLIDSISSGSLNQLPAAGLEPINNLIKKLREANPLGRQVVNLNYLNLKTDPYINFLVRGNDSLHIPRRPNSVAVVGEVLNSSTLAFNPNLDGLQYIELAGGFNEYADKDRIFVIFPNGQAKILKRSLFSSKNALLPGSTIVVSRDSNPFDIIEITRIVTPILADLATSAAAIAAISDD